VILVFISC